MKASTRTIVIFSTILFLTCSMLPAQAVDKTPERADQIKRLLGAAWWNNPAKIEELGLTSDQREQMNNEIAAYLEAIASERSQQKINKELNHAIVVGSWDAARELAKELAATTTDKALQQSMLKIKIMSLLTGDQRKLFAAKYPRLLERQWPQTPAQKSREKTTDKQKKGDQKA